MPTITPTRDLPAITEGDDIHFPVSFVDPSGNPIDISGWTISTTVKSYDGGSPVIQKDVANHRNATGGETGFEFQAGETAGLSGSYRYDIQVTKGNGEIRTVVIGTLPFVDGVTDRTPGSGGSGGDAAGGGVGISVALGTDSIAVDVLMGAGTFGPSDAVAAMDGATITPAQVGTQSNPFTGYVDELSVGGENQTPTKEILRDTPPSDGTTQTFDIASAVQSVGPKVGMWHIRIGTNHTEGPTYTTGRAWWGEFRMILGADSGGNLNAYTKMDIIPVQATSSNMSLSIDNKLVLSYSGTYNYIPEIVVESYGFEQ